MIPACPFQGEANTPKAGRASRGCGALQGLEIKSRRGHSRKKNEDKGGCELGIFQQLKLLFCLDLIMLAGAGLEQTKRNPITILDHLHN